MNPPESIEAKASALGHTLVWDPPFASSARRWSCSVCNRAGIQNGTVEYGTALDTPCTQPDVEAQTINNEGGV